MFSSRSSPQRKGVAPARLTARSVHVSTRRSPPRGRRSPLRQVGLSAGSPTLNHSPPPAHPSRRPDRRADGVSTTFAGAAPGAPAGIEPRAASRPPAGLRVITAATGSTAAMSNPDDPRRHSDAPPLPNLPAIDSPPPEDVLADVPSKDEVIERAPSADEVVEKQPSVDELLDHQDH